MSKYLGKVIGNDGVAMRSVRVTDGANVTQTDSEGAFILNGWRKAKFITITVPSGYHTESFYIKIDKATASYDFTLDKLNVDYTNHSFLHIADSEIGESGSGKWLDVAQEIVSADEYAFIVHTGDICYEAGLRQHIKDMNIDTMSVPVRYVIGNHDYVRYGDSGEALYEELYGPTWYSFEVGNIHYVATPIIRGDVASRYNRSEVWRWLEGDIDGLADGMKVVIFNHTCCPDGSGFVVRHGLNRVSLRSKGLIAWIFGHWHYTFLNDENGVLNISTSSPSSGGADHSAGAMRSIKVTDNKLTGSTMHYSDYTPRANAADSVWSVQLEGSVMYSEMIIDEDRLYVATCDESYPTTPAVYCMDINSGEIIWSFKTANSVRNNMSLVGGKLIIGDSGGKVYCLDSDNGTMIWQTDVELTKRCNIGVEIVGNTGSGVLVEGDKVYCGNQKKVVCISLDEGKLKWTATANRGDSSPSRMRISGDTLIVSAHWWQLYGYNKHNGKRLWKYKNKGHCFGTATPYVYDGKLIMPTGEKLFELNASSGKLIREQVFEGYNLDTASSALVLDGIGYYTTANRGVVAIDMQTLRIVWTFDTEASMIYTSPYTSSGSRTVEGSIIEAKGVLYFGASDGYVYALDKANGTMIKRWDIGVPVLSQLVYVDGNLIVADFEGRVTCIDITR